MVDIYVVPVFHHRGHFGRGPSGTLEYIGGKVEKFPKMDLDFVNFGDLVTLFKGLGYATYRAVYWYDPTSSDIESGLHFLRGDAGINEMRENKLRNSTTNEFYIYFDHPVDEPQIVEEEEDNAAEQGAEEHAMEDQNQLQGEKFTDPSAGEVSGTAPVAALVMGQPSAPAQTPFRPPSLLPRVDQPKCRAATPKFKPKQPIVRLPTSANPPSHKQQTQSKSTSGGPSKETLKAANSGTIRILKH